METSSVEDGEMNIWRYIINIEIFDNWKNNLSERFLHKSPQSPLPKPRVNNRNFRKDYLREITSKKSRSRLVLWSNLSIESLPEEKRSLIFALNAQLFSLLSAASQS